MQLKTGLILNDKFSHHFTGLGHPESQDRYRVIANALKLQANELQLLESRQATTEELHLCHTQEYCQKVYSEIAQLKQLGFKNIARPLSTGDVQISLESLDVALLAAGSLLNAVDAVMQGKVKNAFCPVRPPGHHATSSVGMGFCLFNNIAIAARYLQKKYATSGINKIFIVDWDVHHGNGTQEIFYNDPSVFYFSTHQEGAYPNTGKAEERGIADNIMNIPIKPGVDSRQRLLNAYQTTLVEAVEKFKPDFVLISSGFDAHKLDPLGGLDLEDEDFVTLTEIVCSIAQTYCKGRVVSVLEGGYSLAALRSAVTAHVKTLANM